MSKEQKNDAVIKSVDILWSYQVRKGRKQMKFIDYLNQLVEKSNEKMEFKVEYKIQQIIKCKGCLERNIIKRSMKGYRSFTINWDPVKFEFDFDVVKEVCDIINHDKDFHITLNMKINQKHEHDYKLTITW